MELLGQEVHATLDEWHQFENFWRTIYHTGHTKYPKWQEIAHPIFDDDEV